MTKGRSHVPSLAKASVLNHCPFFKITELRYLHPIAVCVGAECIPISINVRSAVSGKSFENNLMRAIIREVRLKRGSVSRVYSMSEEIE